MFKIGLIALTCAIGISRAPSYNNVSWLPYANGYSYITDLSSDISYDVTFNSDNTYIEKVTASYYYVDNTSTSTIQREYNSQNYDAIAPILFGYTRGVDSSVIGSLKYAYDYVNSRYAYGLNDVVGNSTDYAIIQFNRSNGHCYLNSNIVNLGYQVIYVAYYSDNSSGVVVNNGVTTQDDYNLSNVIDLGSVSGNANWFTISVSLTDYNLNTDYEDGYSSGYSTGLNQGNESGYNSGYNVGYNVGFTNGANASSQFADLLFTIADTPIYYLKSLFNFELFGVNVAVAILSLMTLAIALWVVHKVV